MLWSGTTSTDLKPHAMMVMSMFRHYFFDVASAPILIQQQVAQLLILRGICSPNCNILKHKKPKTFGCSFGNPLVELSALDLGVSPSAKTLQLFTGSGLPEAFALAVFALECRTELLGSSCQNRKSPQDIFIYYPYAKFCLLGHSE